MSRRTAATLVVITALVIDAISNGGHWPSARGWDQTAGVICIVWCVTLFVGES